MSAKRKSKNLGASVHQRLKNMAKAEQRPFMALVEQYAYTGFLRRLSASPWGEFFTLKGGMMMLVLTGETVRPTKDVDLDGPRRLSLEELREAISDILDVELEEEDGVVLSAVPPEERDVVKDRTGGMISGAKLRLDAMVGTARVKVNIDVAFENAITPKTQRVTMPLQLEDESPVPLNMYPVESSISEKFRALIFYGKTNSRVKDFYDIEKFSQMCEFDGDLVAEALQNSCEVFGLDIPQLEDIEGLDPANVEYFQSQWAAFLRKNGVQAGTFEECQRGITDFMGPVVDYIHGKAPAPGNWKPGIGWEKTPSLEMA